MGIRMFSTSMTIKDFDPDLHAAIEGERQRFGVRTALKSPVNLGLGLGINSDPFGLRTDHMLTTRLRAVASSTLSRHRHAPSVLAQRPVAAVTR